jgi:uncharacterized protein YecE (DUF72 family)
MLLAGCVLDRPPGAKYCKKLRFAELDLRDPLPRAGTLRKWRDGLPEGFEIALRAPRQALESAAGPLRPSPERDWALRWTLEAADALAASWVLLATPPGLTPGARSRELLQELARSLPRTEGRDWVWSYSGAWEAEQAERVAAELGFVCAFDPLEAERPPGDRVYARLRALGHRRSFSEASLQDAIDTIGPERTVRGVISLDSERAFQHATRLQSLIDGGGDEELDEV